MGQGVKTLPSNSGGTSWIPGWGIQVSHAAGWGKKLKKYKQKTPDYTVITHRAKNDWNVNTVYTREIIV